MERGEYVVDVGRLMKIIFYCPFLFRKKNGGYFELTEISLIKVGPHRVRGVSRRAFYYGMFIREIVFYISE